MLRALTTISLVLSASGCAKVVGDARADEPHRAASAAAPAPSAAPAASAKPVEPSEPGTRYGVPFGWELSKDEPLARARGYLGDMLVANGENVALGKNHFAPFAEKQAPRATVVTCADSRVQANAYDATPENDAFTIRNIGNQVERAYGSVQYGLEHLHTPVLLILGHTGCGAVKAAMGKLDALEPPIQAELSGMKLPPADPKASERRAWADAVVANVHLQVDFAVTHFAQALREQRVVVVGAVYDFRNDLGRGFGRLSVVNVNGNLEPPRMRAFEASLAAAAPRAGDEEALPGLARANGSESTLAALLRRQAAGDSAPEPQDTDDKREKSDEHGKADAHAH
jgi:carbonic anhydrase